MIWGCFSEKGVGNIHIIESKMNKFKYTTILNDNLFKSAKYFNLKDF